ncbi:General stress protein 13 [bioreactor metagenome]|uniref:General stress protein 13 n=1 Tax=bioreactor metagenome TaxID=1076179 RepID=A0A644ZX83_9ZZZZ
MKEITIGTITEGTVTGIQAYGAFIQLDEKTTGLVHISEISHNYISNISDYLKLGDKLRVKVIDIDKETKQVRLSLKALNLNPRKERIKRHRRPMVMKIGFKTVEEMLPQWISEAAKEKKHD